MIDGQRELQSLAQSFADKEFAPKMQEVPVGFNITHLIFSVILSID